MANGNKSEKNYWTMPELKVEGKLRKVLEEFVAVLKPLEGIDQMLLLKDARTKAVYCECHLRASAFIPVSTTDVPLDPAAQVSYRANREVVADHDAYHKMRSDAKQRRSFSNVVAEFTRGFDPEHPLKIIGGQHRTTPVLGGCGSPWRGCRRAARIQSLLSPHEPPAPRCAAHFEHEYRNLQRSSRPYAGNFPWSWTT